MKQSDALKKAIETLERAEKRYYDKGVVSAVVPNSFVIMNNLI